ncbi:MAG: hypothetical protein WHT47_07580 [Hydrogenothermaceae bacterium]
MTPEEYARNCKRTTPSPSIPSGLSPNQQMQLQMFQSILQPFFNSLFDFSSLFAPPETSYKESLRRQQEEEKRKAIEAWNKHLQEAEEQAKKEALSRQKAGQDILSKTRIGSGFFGSYTIIGPRTEERQNLSQIDWSSPRHTSPSQTQGTQESAKEQLLRTAYFSKMAETFLQLGDMEAARFYAGLAFEGEESSPRAIDYKPPKELLEAMDSKKAEEINRKLTEMSRFYKLSMPKIEMLQVIYTKLEEVKTKKEESKKKLEEVENQLKEIEAKRQTKQPEETAKTDDLLAKALALKQKAESEYQEALQNEQKLMQEKQKIENEINELKNRLIQKEKK